jgi:RNA polymerase sigma factor (sigma-70 family)
MALEHRKGGHLIDHIHQVVGIQAASALLDQQLLERYLRERDEAAFAVLVQRHGPMVWGVCRRALPGRQDAEDAFQATFLVLVRRAGSIRKSESLSPWLHGVAQRIAVKAREQDRKRRRRECLSSPAGCPDPLTEVTGRELCTALDEELSRLPAAYRAVLVLCCLEGKTRDEAAAELGCPLGTVRTRLARGRRLLAQRLSRRGIAAPAALAAGLLAPGAALSSVPAALAVSTVRAALTFVGPAAVATNADRLAEGVLNAMSTAKRRLVTVILLTLALVGGGVTLLASHGQAPQQSPKAAPPPKTQGQANAIREETRKLLGAWERIPAKGERPLVPKARPGEVPSVGAERGNRAVFDTGELVFELGDARRVWKYRLDPTRTPKAITLTDADGVVCKGTYALKGDTLELCLAPGGAQRPKEMADDEERGVSRFVYRRERQAGKRGRPGKGKGATPTR